jgi:hypothetical protein
MPHCSPFFGFFFGTNSSLRTVDKLTQALDDSEEVDNSTMVIFRVGFLGTDYLKAILEKHSSLNVSFGIKRFVEEDSDCQRLHIRDSGRLPIKNRAGNLWTTYDRFAQESPYHNVHLIRL